MNEPKPTPGEWKEVPINRGLSVIRSGEVTIADFHAKLDGKAFDGFPSKQEQAANVALFLSSRSLLEALKGVMELIESGQLRRNTSNDANPDWAMRQVPFVMALAAAKNAIDVAEGRE